MLTGSASSHCCRSDQDRARSAATAISSTPSSGGSGQGFPGATCPNDSEHGRPCTTGFPDGRSAGSGSGSSRSWPSKSMKPAPSWMPPSFGRTKTPRAEKGGPTQSSWPFSRRCFDQNPRGHDDAREAAPRHADPRPPARGYKGRGVDRARSRQSLHRRLGLQLEHHPRSDPRPRHEARHRPESHAQGEGPPRSEALCAAISSGVRVPYAQTIPCRRYSL
jgi:hypothetical protein